MAQDTVVSGIHLCRQCRQKCQPFVDVVRQESVRWWVCIACQVSKGDHIGYRCAQNTSQKDAYAYEGKDPPDEGTIDFVQRMITNAYECPADTRIVSEAEVKQALKTDDALCLLRSNDDSNVTKYFFPDTLRTALQCMLSYAEKDSSDQPYTFIHTRSGAQECMSFSLFCRFYNEKLHEYSHQKYVAVLANVLTTALAGHALSPTCMNGVNFLVDVTGAGALHHLLMQKDSWFRQRHNVPSCQYWVVVLKGCIFVHEYEQQLDETLDLLQLSVKHHRVATRTVLFNVDFTRCCFTATEKSSIICGQYRNMMRAERYLSIPDVILSDDVVLEILTGLARLKPLEPEDVTHDVEADCRMLCEYLSPFVETNREILARLKSVSSHQPIFSSLTMWVRAVTKYANEAQPWDTPALLEWFRKTVGPVCEELVQVLTVEPSISTGIAETALDLRATKKKPKVVAQTIASLGAVLSQVDLTDPLTSAVSVPTPECYKLQLRDAMKQRMADKPSLTSEHGHGNIDGRLGYVQLTKVVDMRPLTRSRDSHEESLVEWMCCDCVLEATPDGNDICMGPQCPCNIAQVYCTRRCCINPVTKNSQCGNIHHIMFENSVLVQKVGDKGYRLVAKKCIEAGEDIFEYTGERINKDQHDERKRIIGPSSYCSAQKLQHDQYIDALVGGNESRFIRHACKSANCGVIIVTEQLMTLTPGEPFESSKGIRTSRNIIIIKTLRKINAGEELTYRYSNDRVIGLSSQHGCECADCKVEEAVANRKRKGDDPAESKQLPKRPRTYNADGFDKDGFNKHGFNKHGFNKHGFNKDGFDKDGFNRSTPPPTEPKSTARMTTWPDLIQPESKYVVRYRKKAKSYDERSVVLEKLWLGKDSPRSSSVIEDIEDDSSAEDSEDDSSD